MKYKRAFTVIFKILVKSSDSQCATFYLWYFYEENLSDCKTVITFCSTKYICFAYNVFNIDV